MKYSIKQSGFSAVELLITLFIAAAFMISGFQLYAVVIKDGGEARMKANASNIAADYLQKYKSNTNVKNPCVANTNTLPTTTLSESEAPGLSNVTVSVATECLVAISSMSKIIVTLKYGTPQQTITNSTYVTSDGIVLDLNAGNPDSYIGTGTEWNDLSGNDNNGTLNGTFTLDNTNNIKSLIFNGSNSYVDAGSGASLNIRTAFTISSWVKKSRNGSYERIVFKDSSSTSHAWGLQYAATNNVQLLTNSDGSVSGNRKGDGIKTITDFNWHYIVGTYNGSIGSIYIDGVLDNQGTLGSTGFNSGTLFTGNLIDTTSNPLYVGRLKYNSLFYYLQGQIANIKIYNRALSSTEIKQNYDSAHTQYGL